ncbi:MAG: DUF2281 domain-containing protein [Microcoleus sp. PH2017_10_PVI_O_A]|uniref:DUF2281 domain-containing protein n=1 Tax=unclassified Microcoleus TaxID=2642155 RepID=UPI001D9CB7D4|nr:MULTISPECIES: hypothetical protein [unclassified Microcoleus]TAE85470.1 MAG: DUF2281 domain-containing protein [Oscillatoriales cyanobacterium]MCC3404693.1 DUF2281 domain-containing protein [Microcoleus sp. PH2017_10_PVI_O_A]MCC3458713.1 DUF2281 domain-containing protein [Microcoleus sp. PH2017_11_PCY_U_A]MCC3477533.1 DUF2281 domain-containing protein [Microcoleus sp. PH2017_12_PCY_D_A]MCC3558089.1 DUF2281 domain-containing protein [Microcoleus sp. PH2017_27_LUM_O_A]
MTQTLDIEKILLENLRMLSTDKQQEVLDFVEFLVQKGAQTQHLSSESSESSNSPTEPPPLKLSLTEIAKLPIAERHKILAPYMAVTAQDFLTDPELTEFSVLDGEDYLEDYLIDTAITRSHDAFLKGYAPEDEGLYDDTDRGYNYRIK